MAKQIELIKAKTFELDPAKLYLIGLDVNGLTREDAAHVNQALVSEGINAVICLFRGDPNNAIKIIEQPAPQ